MDYITEIFERLNLQQIREFLLHGVECVKIDRKSYKERIDDARKPAIEMIENKFPDMSEYEKITDEVYRYGSVTQDIYMEIGMICGARLISQLLNKGGSN